MRLRSRTYTTYSISCFVVWAIILTVVATRDREKLRTFGRVFGGWTAGWLSATIARAVYPSPSSLGPYRPSGPSQ